MTTSKELLDKIRSTRDVKIINTAQDFMDGVLYYGVLVEEAAEVFPRVGAELGERSP